MRKVWLIYPLGGLALAVAGCNDRPARAPTPVDTSRPPIHNPRATNCGINADQVCKENEHPL